MVPHALNLVKRDVGNAALPITLKNFWYIQEFLLYIEVKQYIDK